MASEGAVAFLVAGVACACVAGLIFFARPGRLQNRLLGLALFLDGLNWLMVASRIAARDANVATASWFTQAPFLMASAFVYLAFLGTLETPLTRALRGRRAMLTLLAGLIAVLVLYFARTSIFYSGALAPGPEPWRWNLPDSERRGVRVALACIVVILAFAMVAAVDAWRRCAPGTPARSRAGWYAIAFAVRDLALLTDWIVILVHAMRDLTSLDTSWGVVEIVLLPTSIVAFSGLVAYAILRHQLFDIDVRIKWTLKQSTVAAVFIGLFFVVSESAAQFFSERVGTYLGIVAAGTLVFVIAPLQHFAQRVADRAMPGVKPVGERTDDERLMLYREQLGAAYADGAVNASERALLEHLRARLGIDAEAAMRVETAVGGEA